MRAARWCCECSSALPPWALTVPAVAGPFLLPAEPPSGQAGPSELVAAGVLQLRLRHHLSLRPLEVKAFSGNASENALRLLQHAADVLLAGVAHPLAEAMANVLVEK